MLFVTHRNLCPTRYYVANNEVEELLAKWAILKSTWFETIQFWSTPKVDLDNVGGFDAGDRETAQLSDDFISTNFPPIMQVRLRAVKVRYEAAVAKAQLTVDMFWKLHKLAQMDKAEALVALNENGGKLLIDEVSDYYLAHYSQSHHDYLGANPLYSILPVEEI